jgi:hypothetical protein
MDSALTEELGFQIPVGARDFSSLQNVLTGAGAHPSYSMGVVPRPEVSHTSASSAEIRNEWSYTSTAPMCFHGAGRNVTFSLLIRHLAEIVTIRIRSFVFLQKLLK